MELFPVKPHPSFIYSLWLVIPVKPNHEIIACKFKFWEAGIFTLISIKIAIIINHGSNACVCMHTSDFSGIEKFT